MAQMDTSDERLMEHTEKVVADMLKYVLAPNERRTEDSVEFVIIDESGVTSANAANGMEASDEHPFVFNAPGMKISTPTTDNAFNEVLNDIEMFLAQGLDKIRAEYPMYAESINPYLCNNCLSNAISPQTGGYNLLTNGHTPMNNNSFAGNNAVGSFASTFGNSYSHNNVPRTQTCIGELWNDEDEWPVVGNLPKRIKRVANEPIIDLENDANEEDSSEEEENNETTNAIAAATPSQEHTQNQNTNGTNNQYSEYSATNTVPPATTTAANPFQLSQTALHQTHSTTTTTTAFGVVHQQTSSSTTTNFVSNNLANAALATTPAALYAQALLAQQYWSSILKDAQQRHINVSNQTPIMHNNNNNSNTNSNNNNSNNNNHGNINAAIYERFAYAHLLQQQIIQQQQQAAIAALLQQQKIVIQNNIAAAAVAQATNTNLFAQATNVIGTSCANTFANFSLASNDYSRSVSSSIPMTAAAVATAAAINMNINMHMNTNLFADATKNDISSYNNNNSSSNNNNNNSSSNNNHRNSNNCTPTNSNISLDSLNLNVADHHDERQVACPGIISKVSQSSHD